MPPPGEVAHHAFGQRRHHIVDTLINSLDRARNDVFGAGSCTAAEACDPLILIDADDVDALLRRRQDAAGACRTTRAEDDRSAFADELYCRRCATIRRDKVVDVDTEQVHISVDIMRALLEAVAEFLDRRDINAVDACDCVRTDGIRDLRRQDTSQEAGLIFAELNADVVGRPAHDELIDTQEIDIGIGFRRAVGGIGDQETNRHNDFKTFVDAGLDIGSVVSLRLRFDPLVFKVVFISRFQRAFVGELIEGAIVDPTEVGHQAQGFHAVLRCCHGNKPQHQHKKAQKYEELFHVIFSQRDIRRS